MKDPAVLFYFQDFLVGTEFMTDDETGKYIRILCHQADKGALPMMFLEKICSGKVPEIIMEKLKQNGDGKFYQERMKIEIEKRKSFCESRRKSRIGAKKKKVNVRETYDTRMENENINENKDIDKEKKKELLREKEAEFCHNAFEFGQQYPEEMLTKFCNYWTEKNRSGTKMRWELEKTFEITRRLATWASRDKEYNKLEKKRVDGYY
jgi:hypothetical protein